MIAFAAMTKERTMKENPIFLIPARFFSPISPVDMTPIPGFTAKRKPTENTNAAAIKNAKQKGCRKVILSASEYAAFRMNA
jgi:hypothetical protein